MNGHDFQLEELHVSVSICLSFHGFDLVVDAFQPSPFVASVIQVVGILQQQAARSLVEQTSLIGG